MSHQPDFPIDHAPVRTVLVVDDEALIRLAIAEDLRACGFEVLEASSAPEAIQLLARATQVDVIFSDIHMPGYIDGLGLARWVFSCRPDVSVVLTSAAYSANDLPQEFRRSIPIVAKPYDLSTVLRHLNVAPRRTGRRDQGRTGQRSQHLQLDRERTIGPAMTTGGLASRPMSRTAAGASHSTAMPIQRSALLRKRKDSA